MKPQLLYYDLGPRATAFSTTRQGGCSIGNYAGMNINPYCGDTAEHVSANRILLADELGIPAEHVFLPHQVHNIDAVTIYESFLDQPFHFQQQQLEGIDALMTNVKGVCIGVSTADCIPLIVYSPHSHAAAVIHAGWRGTVQRIASHVVTVFCKRFGAPFDSVRVIIGPGISQKNFEVGDEVYDAFDCHGFDMEQIAIRQEKWHIDLPLCNRLQLEELGIPSSNIHDCGICTYDHSGQFFSARRLGIDSGRIYTGIILR